ncbi:fluoride efflux transporter FluC [Frondihabitans australicus]|uniref:fluoride efflux transporter FluC n=1 Tax=Frondihabitans australicus TaxID=386892 RepID=UPI001FE25B19|nr:CrcB family protein [Frondihabitans australicus]
MRPLHQRPSLILLVALGGAFGTGVREALALAWPASTTGFPFTVFVINVVGAFALGLLLETLTRRGADEGGRRIARLALGTGVLGGFTTYSSLATDVASRLPHATGVALGYAAASLVLGALAAFAGVAVAAAARSAGASRRRVPETTP